MSFVDLDLDEVDDGSELIPDGPRECKIVSVKETHVPGGISFDEQLAIAEKGQVDKWPGWEVRLKPVDEKYKNRTLFLNLSSHPNARWNVKRFGTTLGLVDGKKINVMDAINQNIIVTVGNEPAFNNPDEKRNKVNTPYFKAGR